MNNRDRPSRPSLPIAYPALGFTLFELVVVIVIIAILAAVGLPRLIDTQGYARAAKAKSIHGSIRSAVSLARARCELDLANASTASSCASAAPQVDMDGTLVDMRNRHPTASITGIDAAAGIDHAADGLLANNTGADVRTFDIEGGTAPNCRITYQEASLNGSSIKAPVITVTTTGC